MMRAKYFITADIEAPHPSYYGECDEATQAQGFLYRWMWAEPDGSPPEGCLYFTRKQDAENAREEMRRHGAGLGIENADLITVTKMGGKSP